LQAAFGLDPTDTSTDPLRFLHVSDAFLPEASTLIDKTEVIKRGGAPATAPGGRGGIQMHYERTRARSDNPQDRSALDAVLMVFDGLGVDRRELFRVASRFHWNLWQRERELFFRDCVGTVEAMDRLLKQIRLPDGGTASERGFENATNYVLLRLGRFGHFESKSLEGVRRGHFPQARNPADKVRQPNEWGSTRTITRDANGNPIPFGWVIGWVVKEERA
jgi:CRISPR-associated protein Csm5